MQQRISLVTFGVADLDRSLRFYRDGLGWAPGFTADGVAFFQMPSMVFGLWRRSEMAKTLGVTEETLGPGGMEVAHNVATREAVDETLEQAKQAGARILVAAHEAPWGGYTGSFADPDGYRWEVAWNPGWTLDEAGNTRL